LKKGFVRTLELVLVVALVFGIFIVVSSQISRITTSQKANPSRVTDSLLETMSPYIQENVEEYDLSSVESLINYNLIESNIAEKTILEYNSFLGSFSTNIIHVVTYNFPIGVDSNSIKLHSHDRTYVRNVKWNWFRIPITINTEETRGGNIFVQTEVPSETKEDTFIFYYGDKETAMDLRDFEASNNTAVVSFVAKIPEIKKETQAYLYFSPDSQYVGDYSSLTVSILYNLTVGDPEKTSRADVIFKPTKPDTYMKYSLGGESISTYNNSFNSGQYTKIDGSFLRTGKIPERTRPLPKNYFSSEKTIWIDDEKAMLKVYSWYI
jgi:hypothetical protein